MTPRIRLKRLLVLLAPLLLLVMPLVLGCGRLDPIADPPLPAAPEHGVQLVTPEIVVAPGTELMSCWYTTVDPSADQWVVAMQSWQGSSGHHVIGFVTDETAEEVPDGTVVDCIDPASMARYVPILTPTLTPTDDDRVDVPAGLALKLRAGTRLVVQSHYVNATAETIRRKDIVNLWFGEPVADAQATAPWMVTSFGHSIPPGGPYTLSYDCPVEQALNIYSVVGHMHETGMAITVEAGPIDQLKMLYDVAAWRPDYRDNPPQVATAVDAAHQLAAGDIVRVSCTWDPSMQDHAMTFPEEMCASLMWVYPADRPLFCAAGAP